MPHLVYWYGVPIERASEGFAFLEKSSFVSFEEGLKRGLNKLPTLTQEKVDRKVKLCRWETDLVNGFADFETAANLPKNLRTIFPQCDEKDVDNDEGKIDESSEDEEEYEELGNPSIDESEEDVAKNSEDDEDEVADDVSNHEEDEGGDDSNDEDEELEDESSDDQEEKENAKKRQDLYIVEPRNLEEEDDEDSSDEEEEINEPNDLRESIKVNEDRSEVVTDKNDPVDVAVEVEKKVRKDSIDGPNRLNSVEILNRIKSGDSSTDKRENNAHGEPTKEAAHEINSTSAPSARSAGSADSRNVSSSECSVEGAATFAVAINPMQAPPIMEASHIENRPPCAGQQMPLSPESRRERLRRRVSNILPADDLKPSEVANADLYAGEVSSSSDSESDDDDDDHVPPLPTVPAPTEEQEQIATLVLELRNPSTFSHNAYHQESRPSSATIYGLGQGILQESPNLEGALERKRKSSGSHQQTRGRNFDIMLRKLQEYKKLYGDCNVPVAYEDKELSKFVLNMRAHYKKKQAGNGTKVSDEEFAILEEMGFAWRVKPGRRQPQIPTLCSPQDGSTLPHRLRTQTFRRPDIARIHHNLVLQSGPTPSFYTGAVVNPLTSASVITAGTDIESDRKLGILTSVTNHATITHVAPSEEKVHTAYNLSGNSELIVSERVPVSMTRLSHSSTLQDPIRGEVLMAKVKTQHDDDAQIVPPALSIRPPINGEMFGLQSEDGETVSLSTNVSGALLTARTTAASSLELITQLETALGENQDSIVAAMKSIRDVANHHEGGSDVGNGAVLKILRVACTSYKQVLLKELTFGFIVVQDGKSPSH